MSIALGFMFILAGCSDKLPEVSGYIEANLTYVSTSEPGKLVDLAVHRGDKIKEGQLLFELEKAPLAYQEASTKSQLAQAQATYEDQLTGKRLPYIQQVESDIKKAKALYALDDANYKRSKALYEQNNVSLQELQQYQSAKDQSLAQLHALQHQLLENKLPARSKQIEAQKEAVFSAQNQLKLSQWKLDQVTVKAPASGIIFDNYYWKGEQVKSYMPVVSILVPSQIKLVFFVTEAELSKIQIGERIQFTVDGVAKSYNAKVSYISSEAEYTPPVIYSEQSRQDLSYRIEAKIDVDSGKQWHPGQPVSIILSATQSS